MKQLLCSLLFAPLLVSAYGGGPDPSPAQISQPSFGVFPPCCHWITARSVTGDSLELEDGAVWKTDGNLSDLFYWISTDPLLLTQNQDRFSLFQFRLTNLQASGSIAVNLSQGSVLTNPYAKFLAVFDFQAGEAVLTDGSRWQICPYDYFNFSKWILNDCILIGSNSGWEWHYNFILINSNMNHYVRARQL